MLEVHTSRAELIHCLVEVIHGRRRASQATRPRCVAGDRRRCWFPPRSGGGSFLLQLAGAPVRVGPRRSVLPARGSRAAFHSSRSGTTVDLAPPDAWSSSGASARDEPADTPASVAKRSRARRERGGHAVAAALGSRAIRCAAHETWWLGSSVCPQHAGSYGHPGRNSSHSARVSRRPATLHACRTREAGRMSQRYARPFW